MWVLIPAVLSAAMVAMLMARPVARDAKRICDAAMRVADGDLSARTGVVRNDELGEAAEMFDVMVDRLNSVENGRLLMLSSISHDPEHHWRPCVLRSRPFVTVLPTIPICISSGWSAR